MSKEVIAIDPDSDKSGFAYLSGNKMKVYKLSFIDTIRTVQEVWRKTDGNVTVIIEGGWLNKGNWHYAKSIAMAYRIGNDVGRNHETGRKLVEFLRSIGIRVDVVKPLRKMWKGTDRKITLEELNKQLSFYKIQPIKRCNQDERDAALLALCYSR